MKTQEAGGLFANGQRIPLKSVQIDVKASGIAAKVCVAQRYHNAEKVAVEAVYSFPLEESCAVCGFEIEISGKRIVGKVEEREKAFEQYDAAMAEGHGAFLVDQDRPNIFTASVGNLLPDQEAIVRLTYVTELEQSGDMIRLLIPTTISPRYIPREVAAHMDPAELDHITPPTLNGPLPYGLKLSVQIETATDVAEVACPSHPARVALAGRSVNVELIGENIQLDQDFVLNVKLAKPHELSALVARDGDGVRAMMLNLFPDLSGFRRSPAEFIFIVDRSGSMNGSSIEQARTSLLVALRALENGDKFNVIGFGTTYETLFKESVAYTQSTLDEATTKIAQMDANLGGTEMLAPLQYALENKRAEAIPRVVVLLTDGQIGNESACLELAKKHAARCRIFTFGVGHGVSEHLLRGLARASGGQAEFIHPNERIETKVLRQIARIASASISNVRIDWGNLKTDLVAPAETPQLFNGDRFTVYARVIGGSGGEVAVLADSPGGTLRFPLKVDLERISPNEAIPVLMGRKAIQELEEGRGAARGSSQENRKQNATRARILELALRYQLISSATSFVAVEERADATQAQPAELRRIPIALTKGWGAGTIEGIAMAAPALACRRAAAPMAGGAVPAKHKVTGFFGKVKDALGISTERMRSQSDEESTDMMTVSQAMVGDMVFDQERGNAVPGSAGADEYDELLKITLYQKADGGFEVADDLLNVFQISREDFDAAARKLGGDRPLAERIVSTLLALQVFENRYASRKDEWSMLAEKAQRWLSSQKVAAPENFKDLVSWARAELNVK